MTFSRERALPLALLAITIAAGSYVRLARLGEPHFRGDELRHYYVGQALQRGEGPVFPWGEEYARGIDISRLAGVANGVISDPELATRLPAALFGVLGLFLFAFMAWTIAGPWAAVWAVLLLAIYPEAIDQSRIARFYTYQLIFGLLALFTGWRVVRNAGSSEHPSRREVLDSWVWAALTIVFFLLGARVQVVTLNVALSWGVCVALAAFANGVARGWRSWRGNVPLQLTAGALAGAALAVLVAPQLISSTLAKAFVVPSWVGGGPRALFYYYALSGAFPLLVALIPAIYIAAALLRPRLSAYLLIWFSVPVLLHSLVFPFQGERFILLAVPALFLAAGIAAAAACREIYRVAPDKLQPVIRSISARRLAAALIVSLVAGFALFATPAFNRARRTAAGSWESAMKRENWTAAGVLIDSIDATRTIPIGSVDRFAATFYWGRLDFYAARGGGCLEQEGEELCPDDSRHVPHLPTPAEIQSHYRDASSVLVAIDSTRLIYGNVEPSLHRVLSREAEELCGGKCGSLLLYHWKLSPARGTGDD